MSRCLIDVNIPMYAGGQAHPLRSPAQDIIRAIASGQLDAVTDAEVLQEILHRYLYIGEREKGLQIFDHFDRLMTGRILPVTDVDVRKARALAEEHPRLGPRDLIHLAVMLNHGIDRIVTADRGFDGVEGVTRIDPASFEG